MSRAERRTCRRIRAGFPLHYYAALRTEERRAVEQHLTVCPGCALEWAETRRVLGGVVPAAAFPRESEVDWDAFAARTVARARAAAAATRGAGLPWRGLMPVWGWRGLAAATLVVLAVVLGIELAPRRGGGPPRGVVTAASARFLQDVAARRGASRYLNDSRALLVDLIRSPVRCRKSGGDLDIALERMKSRDLLRRKNLVLGSLGGVRDQRLLELVAQLESLLMQISALDDCTGARQIHELREAIERRQLLLRIDLVTRQMERGPHRV